MTRAARQLHIDLDRYLAFWNAAREDESAPVSLLVAPPTAWHVRETFEPHTFEREEER